LIKQMYSGSTFEAQKVKLKAILGRYNFINYKDMGTQQAFTC